MPVTDVDLMLRIQAGDEEAFRQMWDRHAGSLMSFFYWYGLPREDAEDGVQEVFQKIWLARENYQPTGRFRSFLLRIATNYLIDRGRAIQRRPGSVSIDTSMDDDGTGSQRLSDRLAADAPSPDTPIEGRETRDWIERAILRLPEGQRVVFILGVQEEIKYSEIGAMLGIPEGTVKSRMHSAIHYLRDVLQREREQR